MEVEDDWEVQADRKVKNCFKFINTVGIFLILIPLLVEWNEINPCLQRIGVVAAASLIYWKFKPMLSLGYVLEVFQFFIIFLYSERQNHLEKIINPYCDEPTTIFTKIAFTIYYFFLGYYLGITLAVGLLVIGTFIYSIYDNHVQRRLNKLRGIRGDDFKRLEVLKFDKNIIQSSEDHSKTTCSICLVDFEDREEYINLPVCNHGFHVKCIKLWFKTRHECPNCRSNVRQNLNLPLFQDHQQEENLEVQQ